MGNSSRFNDCQAFTTAISCVNRCKRQNLWSRRHRVQTPYAWEFLLQTKHRGTYTTRRRPTLDGKLWWKVSTGKDPRRSVYPSWVLSLRLHSNGWSHEKLQYGPAGNCWVVCGNARDRQLVRATNATQLHQLRSRVTVVLSQCVDAENKWVVKPQDRSVNDWTVTVRLVQRVLAWLQEIQTHFRAPGTTEG